MGTEKEIIEVAIEHPMEDVLDIEPGTTMVEHVQRSTDLTVHQSYDEKDAEIEGQYQEIFNAAMDQFDTQSGEAELVEGKYKARNAEVAAQYLNTALAAVKGKADVKMHKDKVSIETTKAGTPKTLNQNVIVADRNDVLRAFMEGKDEAE